MSHTLSSPDDSLGNTVLLHGLHAKLDKVSSNQQATVPSPGRAAVTVYSIAAHGQPRKHS